MPRFLEFDFAPHYDLHTAFVQRISTEMRVPLLEGFTMPPQQQDPETNAMYKSILLRPLHRAEVHNAEQATSGLPEEPFTILSAKPPTVTKWSPSNAFSLNWKAFAEEQLKLTQAGYTKFLERNEWPSIWNTQEAWDALEAACASEDVESTRQTRRKPFKCLHAHLSLNISP